ncbi:MAG: hypothetical protein ABI443_02100 [Chthoniobacterales bacterium]
MKRAVTSLIFLLAASLLHAQTPDALIEKGDQMDKALKNADALQDYLEADKLHPNDSHTLNLISREYALLMADAVTHPQKADFAKKALDYAERAKAANPNNAKARLGLAICYGRVAYLEPPKKRIEFAKKIQEEAEASLKLDPTDDYAWHVLGRWNYEIANLNPVMAFIVAKLYGKFPDASNAKAIEYFQKAIAINPNRLIHHAELGRAYAAAGNKIEARKELELALHMPSKEKDDEETKERTRGALKQL